MIEWILPAAKEAFAHREEALSFAKRAAALIRARRIRVLVTGAAGAGKSVMAHRLSGLAYERQYAPPGRSAATETAVVSHETLRLKLHVVPGQLSRNRADALQRYLARRRPVHGMIHVMSHGLVSLREPAAKMALIEHGITTLESFQEDMKAREIEELKALVPLIRNASLARGYPRWLLVAVNKYDLTYRDSAEVEHYYSPFLGGPVRTVLSPLTNELGSARFRWAAAPMCSRSEHFAWNGVQVRSSFEDAEREHFIALFLNQIKELIDA